MTQPPSATRNVFDLARAARSALGAGAPAEAVTLLRQAIDIEPQAFGLWLNYAIALRQCGDTDAALQAVDEALTLEPRDCAALLTKAGLLELAGNDIEAGRFYGIALIFRSQAPDEPAVQAALSRAELVYAQYVQGLASSIDGGIASINANASQLGINAQRFIDQAAGRRRVFKPEPSTYYYPGLPSYEFYSRDLTPWIEEIEAYTDAIREELEHAVETRSDLFAPYVNEPKGVPVDQWAGLNRSSKWSALQVIRAGVVQRYAPELFPKTLEALALLPQPIVPARTPSAMFSVLQPKTRIPPHTGVSNARLVLHLPLIVPPDCGFRVGGETRQWKPGTAWVFDDTIEHEAWNDSDEPRVILIADIWNMFMTEEDQQVYSAVVQSVDNYNRWGNDFDDAMGL